MSASYIHGSKLQQAIYAKLSGELTAAVYDEVPKNPVYPYLTISDVTENSNNGVSYFGRVTLLNIHIWSRYKGAKESLELAELIVKLLDKQPLEIPGAAHWGTNFSDIQHLKEDDIRHSVLRFRIYSTEE